MAGFEAACRHNSFTKAAYELSLSRAAISRQVIKLEQVLGTTLSERRFRDVGVANDGQRFASAITLLLETGVKLELPPSLYPIAKYRIRPPRKY